MARRLTGFAAAAVLIAYGVAEPGATETPLSPVGVAPSPDGKTLYVACATGNQVLRLDLAGRKVTARIALSAPPTGLAVPGNGARVYVTTAAPSGRIAVLDATGSRVVESMPAGYGATAPALSPDGTTLFVCNRFNDDVSVIDFAAKKEVRRVRVEREPVSAAPTKDGRFLLVANHLHHGRADAETVAAAVSVIDIAAGKVVKELRLPNGSGALQDLRVSPDGRWAAVTHIIGNYHVPTTQLERGWMNTNAATIIDVGRMEILNTVLLDSAMSGSANPWGVAWTPDGGKLIAAHAGTHEITITDFRGLVAKLAHLPEAVDNTKTLHYLGSSRVQADVPGDLSFLTGLRTTVRLPKGDRGPRAIAVSGNNVYAANYFSDTLSVLDLAAPVLKAESVPLGHKVSPGIVRKGEEYFHDAELCFQGWQSCASCHPGGARADALNWDLLNDGIGNPKNSKSLLLAHKTPPAMSLGVRDTAETAVRSGIRHIQFTHQPEEVAAAIDAYLKSLKAVPSPRLADGKLSPSAQRGRALFHSANVGCAACHPAGVFTDLKRYDVGTSARGEAMDTPALVEVWRTAPYLHDGSAATMRDVLTTRNPKDQHGRTSHLTPQQIEDLTEYVLSL